jgi:hypothetical protein
MAGAHLAFSSPTTAGVRTVTANNVLGPFRLRRVDEVVSIQRPVSWLSLAREMSSATQKNEGVAGDAAVSFLWAEQMFTLALNESLFGRGRVMNFFSGDKFQGSKTREERRCECGAQPRLAYQLMDSRRGLTVRIFQCQCGNRTWTEGRE